AEAPDGEAPFSLPIVFTGTTPDGVTLAANISARSPMVHTVEPLTPTTLAPMTRILATLYDGLVLRDVPGYVRLRSAARAQANATITALGGVVRYLAHQYRMNVIGVDVGASSTTLAGATASGEFLPALFSQGGVGPGAGYVLRATDANNLIRWIAATADENMLREYAIHRMTRPRTLAATELELEIEHAFAREAIRMAMRGRGARLGGLNPIDLALSTGGVLSNVSHPALAALILLDGLEPKGITSLALDVANLAGMLGSAAYLSPRIAADVTDADALPLLIGPAVSLAGKPADGEPALRVTLQRGDGSEHTQEVAAGTIVRLPVRNGEQVLLSLFPAATVDAGLGMGQQARANEPIEGGELGIIVDARGRPFAFPASPEERIAKLLSWRRSLMGTGGH
ncbi:MAG TPA: glutamate mutase L, partial [Ktedonobacterales bacterium]